MLWYELRVFAADGLKFRRLSAIGPYIADFVRHSKRLVIEVDGDLHETEAAKRHDANRDAYLRSLGYQIMRFDEPDVIANAWHVAQLVNDKAATLPDNPSRPLRGHPPLKGEGSEGAKS